MNIERVLITGSAGLIGSNLSHYFINNTEALVIGVDDLSGGYESNMPMGSNRFVFIKLDVCDDYLDNVFQIYKPTVVYHLAAYAAEGLSPFIRKYNYINNVIATANVINCCIKHNIKRLIYTSSMAVYGNGIPPFSETDAYNPIDPYAVAKMAMEYDIKIAGEQHGLDWCIIRPHNMYGKYQNIFDPYRNFIGISIYKSLVGEPITIYGDGEQKRAFSEISDSIEPMWRASFSKLASKQIINLGGIKEYTIKEIANIISEISGSSIVYLEPRHEVKFAYSTWEKSSRILEFIDKTKVNDGIEKMWQWAKTIPIKDRKIFDNYELNTGLYQFWEKNILSNGNKIK